jgi:subtilisin family serine protease
MFRVDKHKNREIWRDCMIKGKVPFKKLNIVLGTTLLLMVSFSFYPASDTQWNVKENTPIRSEIVVVFQEDISDSNLQSFTEQFEDSIEVISHIGDYALLTVKETSNYTTILKQIQEDPKVQVAQENLAINTMGFSNDTYADSQWAIENPGYYNINLSDAGKYEKSGVKGIDMDVVEAWKAMKETSPKQEVVIAVIDTGVDYTHPDLAEHMWVNDGEIDGDKIDNDDNGFVDDIYGWDFYNYDATVCHFGEKDVNGRYRASKQDNDDHGTHVAGIIGAVANNKIGIAGVASNINVKIMSLKINGGPRGTGNISDAIEAIKYATMMGADICNLSWGTTQYTAVLKQIMKESDMLFVAAAGNTGNNNNDNPIYPASLKLDNLISVTFIDSSGELTNLSNYGSETVDLAAPGEDIFSTVVGSYISMSGSSMAAPQVSAVAAIMFANDDNLYPANIKEILLENIKLLPDLEGRMKYPGIPNAYLSVMSTDQLINDTKPPEMTFKTIYVGSEMLIPVQVVDQGSSELRVVKWYMGVKTLEDFGHGVKGNTMEDNEVQVSKEGMYTFYAADYAGNETIATYEVLGDMTAPKLTANYTVADNYKSRTVTIRAKDAQSGIKRVKYMSGIKSAKDFLPAGAGTEIQLESGKGTFTVKKDGTYTIFASDNRGNLTVSPIVIKTVKATEISFTRSEKTMKVGDRYSAQVMVKPIGSTDRITYESSKKSVATVSSSGRVEALAKGTTYITARTQSGFIVKCKITVG